MLKTHESKTEKKAKGPAILDEREDLTPEEYARAYQNKMLRPQNKMQVIYTNKVMVR